MLGFITFFILKMEKELWKQVMLLISFTILFMGTSHEYKLISVLLPFYLFLQSKEKSNYDILYVILFSILLIPKKLFAGHGGFSFSILAIIDAIILIYINTLIVIQSKPKKIKNILI